MKAVGTSSAIATIAITIPTENSGLVIKRWTLKTYVIILLIKEHVKELLGYISCNWSMFQSRISSMVTLYVCDIVKRR
jgi:hypothetical protein